MSKMKKNVFILFDDVYLKFLYLKSTIKTYMYNLKLIFFYFLIII